MGHPAWRSEAPSNPCRQYFIASSFSPDTKATLRRVHSTATDVLHMGETGCHGNQAPLCRGGLCCEMRDRIFGWSSLAKVVTGDGTRGCCRILQEYCGSLDAGEASLIVVVDQCLALRASAVCLVRSSRRRCKEPSLVPYILSR